MEKQIHFSVDDTFGCFKWLTKNRDNVKTIFDSYVFQFAKEIYNKYGIRTSFYCMYTDGEFSLTDVPEQWKKEFLENKDWMKFGFHAFDDQSRYCETDEARIASDYGASVSSLKRICGEECITNKIRLHYFSASDVAVRYLVKQGIKSLLCADDNRGSYDLSPTEEKIMRIEGRYFSEKRNCEYIPTDVRVENISDIEGVVEKISCLPGNQVEIFTHERFLRTESIRETIFSLFDRIL